MAITVNAASATIDNFDKDKALPAIDVNPVGANSRKPVVNTHLTNNFRSGVDDDRAAAWRALGTVGVAVGPNDQKELAGWDFGFLQFQKVNVVNLFFAGRSRSEGGLQLQAHVPPALATKVGRDSPTNDFNQPWMGSNTSGDKTVQMARGVAVVGVGDHPQLRTQAIFTNVKTGYENFLFHLVDDREFVTIFSALDPLGNFQHLAHFHWHARWEFRFIWKARQPVAIKQEGAFFKMDPVAQGPPKESEIQAFLKDPEKSPRLGSLQLTNALVKSARGIGTPNRIDTEERFGVLPSDFFKP
jgi:hypothetical protein